MSKYLDRLKADKDTIKEAQAVTAEAHAKAEVEKKISSLKSQKATLTAALDEALAANPFSINKVDGLVDEQEANDKKLVRMEALYRELFGA